MSGMTFVGVQHGIGLAFIGGAGDLVPAYVFASRMLMDAQAANNEEAEDAITEFLLALWREMEGKSDGGISLQLEASERVLVELGRETVGVTP